MRNRDAGATEHGRQGGGVDGKRVDEGHPVLPSDLNQRQIGDVGPLGVELGVERVVLLRRHLDDQRLEAPGVDHHGRRCSHGRRRASPWSVALVIAAG